jgi:catalase
MSDESRCPPLSHASGTPVTDNLNIQSAGPRGPALLQDVWLMEKLAHFAREVMKADPAYGNGVTDAFLKFAAGDAEASSGEPALAMAK